MSIIHEDFHDDAEYSASSSSFTERDGLPLIKYMPTINRGKDEDFIRLSKINGKTKLYINAYGGWHLVWDDINVIGDFDAVFTDNAIYSSIIKTDKNIKIPEFITQKDMEIED